MQRAILDVIADAEKIANASKNVQVIVLVAAKMVKTVNVHKKHVIIAKINAVAIKSTFLDFSKNLNVNANN